MSIHCARTSLPFFLGFHIVAAVGNANKIRDLRCLPRVNCQIRMRNERNEMEKGENGERATTMALILDSNENKRVKQFAAEQSLGIGPERTCTPIPSSKCV